MFGFAENDIAVLHMHSGAFLIGRVFKDQSVDGGEWRLRKVRQITLQPNGPGQVNIGFVPVGMPLFTDVDADKLDFPPREQILIAKKAPADMAAAYTKITSGIHLAGAGAGFKLPQG